MANPAFAPVTKASQRTCPKLAPKPAVPDAHPALLRLCPAQVVLEAVLACSTYTALAAEKLG
jgi:hypothetical protein